MQYNYCDSRFKPLQWGLPIALTIFFVYVIVNITFKEKERLPMREFMKEIVNAFLISSFIEAVVT